MSQDFDFSDLTPSQIFWLIALSCPWVYWIVGKANEVYAREQAELAKKSLFGQLWHGGEPGIHWILIAVIGGLIGLIIIFGLSQVVAAAQEKLFDGISDVIEQRRQTKQKQQFDEKIRLMDAQAEKESALSKSAQSKKELIMRLGSIDQFIRVLETENDSSRRTVAIQAAHSELTTLAAKLASEQISREMVEAPEVRQQAIETSSDLVRLGLGEDRLNRDIVRMFKLNQTSIS